MTDGDRSRLTLLGDLTAALLRLTRIPLADSLARDAVAGPPGRIIWAYPVIGALIGATGGAVYAVCAGVGLPALLAAVLGLGAMVALTGAAAENSLARVAGRLADAQPADSLGSAGIIALVLSLAARAGAMAALADSATVAAALIAAGALSQGVVVATRHFLPAADNDDADALDDSDDDAKAAAGYMMAACLIAIVFAALVLPFGAGAAIVAACAAGGAVALQAMRQPGGYGPDMEGAARQVTEIAVLVVLAAVGGD